MPFFLSKAGSLTRLVLASDWDAIYMDLPVAGLVAEYCRYTQMKMSHSILTNVHTCFVHATVQLFLDQLTNSKSLFLM